MITKFHCFDTTIVELADHTFLVKKRTSETAITIKFVVDGKTTTSFDYHWTKHNCPITWIESCQTVWITVGYLNVSYHKLNRTLEIIG